MGRQSQAGTGVVHAPLTLPPSGRAPDGRHRAPSDRSVIGRASSRISACWLQREHKSLSQSPRTSEPLTSICQGDNLEVLTRPPFRPLSRRQPGKENRNERELREGCRRATTLSAGWGSERREGWRTPLRRRRPGGSGAGTDARGRCTRPTPDLGRTCPPAASSRCSRARRCRTAATADTAP